MIRHFIRACQCTIFVGLTVAVSLPLVAVQAITSPAQDTQDNATVEPGDAPAKALGNPAEPTEKAPDGTQDAAAESAPDAAAEGAPDDAAEGAMDAVSSAEIVVDAVKLSRPPTALAEPHWRGYTPRWVGLYGSQLADLIPENFRPISITDLAIALRDDSQPLQSPSELPVSRVTIVAHLESEQLVSIASQLVLPESIDNRQAGTEASSSASWQRYRLGEFNLNLVRPTDDFVADDAGVPAQRQPRILSDAEGNSFAWGTPGSRINFDWSLRCQHIAGGRQWTLQLPNATITRCFIRVAEGAELVAAGGSLMKLTDTPPWDELELAPQAMKQLQSDQSDDNKPFAWYSIETNPGQPVVLRQRRPQPPRAAASSLSVVRGCYLQSQWLGDQLRWTYRMTLDSSGPHDFTELAWADGEVTAVRRDNISVPCVWSGNSVRWFDNNATVRLGDATTAEANNQTSTNWVMEGVSRRQGDRVPLPRPLFPVDRFVVPPQTWYVQVDIPSGSVLGEAQFPPGWIVRRLPSEHSKQAQKLNQEASDGEVDIEHPSAVTWMASGPAPTLDTPWSVSIFPNDAFVFADHQMRFEMDESSIQARGKITVEMPRGALGPVSFELQDGFQFEFVGVGEGRRSVPTGTAAGQGRRLTIWPGGDEVVDNRVVVYVSGRARRTKIADRVASDSTTIPLPIVSEGTPQPETDTVIPAPTDASQSPEKTQTPVDETASPERRAVEISDESSQITESLWLMRAIDCPGQLLATIVPPAGLSWSAKAAIEPSRIPFAELTSAQRRFFAPLPGDAIVFGGAIEATPEVTLEKPDVNLSVSLRTLLRSTPVVRDASAAAFPRPIDDVPISKNANTLWQTLELKTEGTAGEIRSMRLRIAAQPNREREKTSALHNDSGAGEGPNKPLSTQETIDAVTPSWQPMQWFVQLQPGQPETPLGEQAVTRHYIENAGDWEVRIALPPQFTNQSLLVGRRRLRMPNARSAMTIGLPNVPDAASQSAEIWIDSSLQLKQHTESLKGVPLVNSSFSARGGTSAISSVSGATGGSRMSSGSRYRYAPNDQPWVEVLPRNHRSPSGLVVSQRLIAEASVCGTDRLRMTCLARSGTEILLTFPPSLHLVDLRCDDILVTPRVMPGRGIVIPAPATPDLRVSLSTVATSTASAAVDSDRASLAPGGHLSRLPIASPHWRRIEVTWVNQTPLNQWYRWYHFPEIEMNQLVVDTQTEILAANGTCVFQIPDLARPWFPSTAPLLLPTGFMTGLGWVAALMLLSLASIAGRHNLAIIGAGILLTAISVLLWPAAAIPLLTFVAVPLTLAAMQLTTTRWRHHESGNMDPAETPDVPPSKVASNSGLAGAANICWWIAVIFTLVGLSVSGSRLYGQDASTAGSASQPQSTKVDVKLASPTIDVLVPLQSDGNILGNKIYIPETFYNDLYVSNDRLPWQNPMIDRISYRLRLLSPLEGSGPIVKKEAFLDGTAFGNKAVKRSESRDIVTDMTTLTDEVLTEANVAILEARILLTLPANVRRIRVPYQFDQIKTVMQISTTGDPTTVRWGGENDGRAWVAIPTIGRDTEHIELTITLRCQLHWQSPWVTVSCDLPSLPAADLIVTKSDTVENVLLLTPTTSWFVEFKPNTLSTVPPSVPPAVRSDLGERVSNVIPFGSQRQLSLRFQLQTSATANLPGAGTDPPDTDPIDPRRDRKQKDLAINELTLPWYDPMQWHQRYWVHSERGKTVIECEVESRQPLPPEVEVSVTAIAPKVVSQIGEDNPIEALRDSPASTTTEHPQCMLVGTDWTRMSAAADEQSSGTQTMRLMSLATPTRPIRVAWTLPTPHQGTWQIRMPSIVMQPTSAQRPASPDLSIEIPSVAVPIPPTVLVATSPEIINPGEETIGTGAATEPPTSLPWIAWTFADDVQPDWSTMGEVQSLAADQFYAKWTGYLSSIDRAVIGNVSNLTVKQLTGPRWDVTTRHEISIEPSVQHVRFLVRSSASDAVLRNRAAASDEISMTTTPTVGATSYMVQLPDRARLLDWRFEADGSPPISPRIASPDDPATGTPTTKDASVVPTKDAATDNVDVPDAAIPASDLPPPWTVTRRDGVTTLYLITDERSFNIAVDAIVPHRHDEKPNKLGLMSIRKLAAVPSSTTSQLDGSTAPVTMDGTGEMEQSNELQVTRHVDTVVNWVQPVPSKQLDGGSSDAASLLAVGEVLIDRFQSDQSISDAFAPARFRIRKINKPFDIDSRITLRWEEGRWTAQTDCRVTSSYCPDYVDIVLPTRWCESLRIEPPCVSSRQPTLDPAMQVMRLQLRHDPIARGDSAQPVGADSKHDSTRSFRLISRLAVSEITRVSVPELRIMDARRHRIDVVVPTRLTNEQVRWRSNFAGPIERPRWRLETPPASQSTVRSPATDATAATVTEPDAELSVYAVTNPRWSIDLETLPRTDRVARLLHTDHCVLARPAAAALLMISRFDVLPGDQPSLRLALDPAVELQGVWAAARQAVVESIPVVSSNKNDPMRAAVIWEISLPLSRLSQTVEVLTSLRRDLPDVLLPSLVGLSLDVPQASVNWCQLPIANGAATLPIDQAIGGGVGNSPITDSFHNDPRATMLISAPLAPQTRVRWLASNLVMAIRASSDSLADRRDDEVAVWLQPWIARYEMLCHSAGRQLGDDDPIDAEVSHLGQPNRTAGIAAADLLSWQEMDAYIVAQETRYFPDDTLVGETASISWSDYLAITKPPGYVDRWTFAWSGRRLPIQILAAERTPLSEQTLQLVMRGGLFFLLASLLVISALLPRRKLPSRNDREQTPTMSWNAALLNPSLWLLVLSIIALVLIPLPIALGLLAVTLALGSSRAKWWLAPQWKVALPKRSKS